MASTAIEVIGLGIAQPPTLSNQALSALATAHTVIGSTRQLALVQHWLSADTQTVELPKLASLQTLLEQCLSRPGCTVLLASGDPLFFGIGAWLARHFAAHLLHFHPAVSSLQTVCHRLGLSLQRVETISLHGRPLSTLRRYLGRHKTLLVLTDKHSHPQALAEQCIAFGFAESTLTVCERLGYPEEVIRSYQARALQASTVAVDPLNVVVINVDGNGGLLPEFPGIPDALFSTGAEPGKGMISKREVRLAILSLLQTGHSDVVWDIGAGCGGVAVELARWAGGASVHAIEHHPSRLHHLAINREQFGVVDNLHIHAATAPDCLDDLPRPTKVFIGGSDGRLNTLLTQAWQAIPVGGRVVVSAVITPSQTLVKQFAHALSVDMGEQVDIETLCIRVDRGHITDGKEHEESRLPVQLVKFEKRNHESQV